MESITKLEEAIKLFNTERKQIDSKYSIKEGDIQGLEAKKASLLKEIEVLDVKKSEHVKFLGSAESSLRKEFEVKTSELSYKSGQLDNDRAQVKKKEIQAELATKAGNEAKEKYDALYAEYAEKLSELKAKQEKLSAIKF
jgi:chromosome segregation ATPase